MKITVGSTNQVKVGAVRDMIAQYSILAGAEVVGVNVPSGISEQPKSLEETVRGAMNRAKAAFSDSDLSFGIESGLMVVPYTCVIYDGTECHIGISSAFECPPKVVELVHGEGLDLNQAFFKAGITDNPKIGSANGAIGLLTKDRLTRGDYTKQAITMALIHLENPEMYKR